AGWGGGTCSACRRAPANGADQSGRDAGRGDEVVASGAAHGTRAGRPAGRGAAGGLIAAGCHRMTRLTPAVARTPKVTPHRMMPTVCQTMTEFRLAPKPTSVGAVRWLGSAH